MNIFAPHTNGPTRRAPPANRANIATQPVPRQKIEQNEVCPASVWGNGTPAPRNRGPPVLRAKKLWKMWIANNLPTKLVESHSLHTSIQWIYSYFRIKVFCDISPLRLVMYSKQFYKCTIHIRPGKLYHWKKCLQFTTVEVTIHSYYKCMPKTEATNWRRTSKCTAHIGPRKWLLLLVVSVTMHSRQQEVIMYAYHKLLAKNGSHKLTAHIR